MQGFPNDFDFPISDSIAIKQLGNSVAIPAIKAVANNMIEIITNQESTKWVVLIVANGQNYMPLSIFYYLPKYLLQMLI